MPRSTPRRRSRPSPRLGFTLIELMTSVVIVGILAAVAVPKFTNTKGKAYAASMKSDLRNLTVAQEAHFYATGTYAAALSALEVATSPGVTLTIQEAGPAGWSARATHPAASPVTCAVYYGAAAALAPATGAGVVGCQ